MNTLAAVLATILAGTAVERPLRVTVTGSLASSAAQLKAAIASHPQVPAAYFELADVYDATGNPHLTAKILQQMLAAVPAHADVFREVIARYRRLRQHGDAIPFAEAWIQRAPRDPEAHVALATLCLYHATRQRWIDIVPLVDRGLASAEAALTIAPAHPSAVEIKRQLLAFKWTVVSWDDRAAVETMQKTLDAEFPRPLRAPRASFRPSSVDQPAAPPMIPASGRTPLRAGDPAVGGQVAAPACIHSVEPRYPQEALDARAHGYVAVAVLIDETGRVQEVRAQLLEFGDSSARPAHRALERAARDSIGQWRFEPTIVNGVPVPVVLSIEVEFKLTL